MSTLPRLRTGDVIRAHWQHAVDGKPHSLRALGGVADRMHDRGYTRDQVYFAFKLALGKDYGLKKREFNRIRKRMGVKI